MKEILIFISIAIFSYTTAQSQEFRLGIKAGLNVASLGGSNYGLGNLGARTSFHIGGLVEIPLRGKFAIQPELLYSSEGADWSLGNEGRKIKLDYIRVPLMAKYYIIEGLSAEAGPVFGFLVSADKEDHNEDTDITFNYRKDFYKSFDTALGIGASYLLDMGVFFSLRYNKGLININKDRFSQDYKYQNNVFQVSAGYSF